MREMTELRDLAISAHGGLNRWNALRTAHAHVNAGGAVWQVKGQEGVLDDINVRIDLHRQFASHSPFTAPGLRTSFRPDRIAVETEDGTVVEELYDPKDSFKGHVLETEWDRLQLGYFAGSAIWTYLTAPFAFAMPGFRSEEMSPWQEEGQTWRRLRVTYPDSIATHLPEQTFFFDREGLLRRHDFTAEVVGGGPAANYAYDYQEFDGIMVPTKRRIHPRNADGTVDTEPVLVSIDLEGVTFE